MKVPKQVERRRIMAVHLPESLMSKRIQNLVGRFVEEDGELGFVFQSTRYGRGVMGLELAEPRLRNLLAWLAERQETMLLTGRRSREDPELFWAWTRVDRAAPCPPSLPRRRRPNCPWPS